MYTQSTSSKSQQVGFDYTSLNKTASKEVSSAEAQQNRFLKLYIAQLQNQDPLNPMDNAQTTTQLAQINTVTGIEKLNQTMQSMMQTFAAAQSMQAAGILGKEVMATGNTLTFNGASTDFDVTLSKPAQKVAVAIVNSQGNIVDSMVLPAQTSGTKALQWDGLKDDGTLVANGNYTIVAKGLDVDGNEFSIDVATWQKAKSVELGAEGVKVVLADGSKVSFSAVSQIR